MDYQTSTRETVRETAATGSVSGLGQVFCKCGDGWKCVITRTRGPDAGKPFFKCQGNCNCVIDGKTVSKDVPQSELPPEVKVGESEAYCYCGEGWSCVITKVEGPNAGKASFECTGGCTCVANA